MPPPLLLASCLQKFHNPQDVEGHAQSLQFLAEYLPNNSSESLQILEASTSYCERQENSSSLNADSLVFLCQLARRQIQHCQESAEVSSLLIAVALQIFDQCGKATETLKEHGTNADEIGISPGLRKALWEIFTLSDNICNTLEKCSFLTNSTFLTGVQAYVCKILDFMKFCCIFSQKGQLFEDFHKNAQELSSSVIKILLRLRELCLLTCDEEVLKFNQSTSLLCLNIICNGVKIFVDLGCFATENGRDWVGLLNVVWKGVTAILHATTEREIFSKHIDLQHVMVSLFHCASHSLVTAWEAWKSQLEGKQDFADEAELKKLCIPIKFFLINAIRIASSYPYQAASALKEIATCGLNIAAVRHELTKHALLKFAAEAITEIVEPTMFILFHSLLNSSELMLSHKLQLLDHLIGLDGTSEFSVADGDCFETKWAVQNMLSDQAVSLQFGKLTIFLRLLETCKDYGQDVTLELCKRLDIVLEIISGAKLYAEVFQLHALVSQSSTKATWECLCITILKTLRIFFINTVGTKAWDEAQMFLFRNILHPHALCRELILDIWCFVARHCEPCLLEAHIQHLLEILNMLLSRKDENLSNRPVEMIGRLVCSLVKAASNTLLTVDTYKLALGDDLFTSQSKSVLGVVLMKEHFPVSCLPDDLKKNLLLSIKKLLQDQISRKADYMVISYAAIEAALYCLLEILIQEHDDQLIEKEQSGLAKLLIRLFQASQSAANDDYTIKVLCLEVISRLWQNIQIDEVGNTIVTLHDMVKRELCEKRLMQIKPVLAEALAALGDVPLPENKGDSTSSALWGLYHMLLREKHWAFAHLALASFGYFAAHTSWKELWRFMPNDAALSYDAESGNIVEELFMSSLCRFLEKDVPSSASISRHDIDVLQQEGESQEALLFRPEAETQKVATINNMDSDIPMVVTDTPLLPEIQRAMKMLQGGLSLLREKLLSWLQEIGHGVEQHVDDQLCLLTDIIAQLNQEVTQYAQVGH